uniref:Ribonuclease H-like domain-containing protein n=1 Tax=Tanacetum cinerariifolium TaxID=118510 RepID=A0A699H407_TANCI|nr:ribonuclease H-like domain-containing protein [Tanacetum cinerariifolium]
MAQAKRLFRNKKVLVEIHRGIAWDNVENPNLRSSPQVLPSFEVYTPPVTYPKEVKETIGTLIEVEPLDKTRLEDLGLNTCNRDLPVSSVEVPRFDELKPQPQPLHNCPSLDEIYCYYHPCIDDPKKHYGFKLVIIECLVKINLKARILELKQRYFEDYCSDNQYAVSIKEDTTHPWKCDCVERIPVVTVFILPYPDSG